MRDRCAGFIAAAWFAGRWLRCRYVVDEEEQKSEYFVMCDNAGEAPASGCSQLFRIVGDGTSLNHQRRQEAFPTFKRRCTMSTRQGYGVGAMGKCDQLLAAFVNLGSKRGVPRCLTASNRHLSTQLACNPKLRRAKLGSLGNFHLSPNAI